MYDSKIKAYHIILIIWVRKTLGDKRYYIYIYVKEYHGIYHLYII